MKERFSKFFRQHGYAVIWLLMLAVSAGALLLFESHLLWKVQEQSLFLCSGLFFRELMLVPGGFLAWLGSLFTQFLFMPWLGVGLLCGWWLVLLCLMKRAFRLEGWWNVLLLLVPALLLVANVDMGYWVYALKLKGWFFDATIGTTFVVACLVLYSSLASGSRFQVSGYKSWLLLLLIALVGYPLFGTYALFAVLLCVIVSPSLWKVLAGVLLVVATPLVYYYGLYYQTALENIWWTGLPVFKILEAYPLYYLPYLLLALVLIGFTIVRGRQGKDDHDRHFVFRLWYLALLLVGLVAGVWCSWFKGENFHHELAMQHYMEQVRWADVLKEAEKQKDEPTRPIVMMRNLALSRYGLQGEEMYRFRGGSKRPNSVFPFHMSLVVGKQIYYHYGLLNECHRLCIEDGVEHGWNVSDLKYLARCAMLDGEWRVMTKFTGLLKQTLFYGSWAHQLEKLQTQPELIAEVLETGPITRMMGYPDMVGTDEESMETYLMRLLSQLDSHAPFFQEQMLLASMWTRDASDFWRQFVRYLELHPGERIPRLYQEACWLFAHQTKRMPENVAIDESVKKRFRSFMSQLQQYNGRPLPQVQAMLYQDYGNTYFYDFFLMNKLTYF